MKKIKTQRRTILLTSVFAIALSSLCVAGCSGSTSTNSNSSTNDCAWTSSNYTVNEDGTVTGSEGSNVAVRDYCLKCHGNGATGSNFTWDDIVASTQDWNGNEGFNPHESHLENISCDACHASDGSFSVICQDCHDL